MKLRKRMYAAGVCLLLTAAAGAEEPAPYAGPWEKAGIELGLFLSSVRSDYRMGLGSGLSIAAENLLQLDSQISVFRMEGFWRFSGNRRHRLDVTRFAFHRQGSAEVIEDFTFTNLRGEQVVVDVGTTAHSTFNIDIHELAYSYSFFQDSRFDFAVRGGFYIMPVEVVLSAEGYFEKRGEITFTAPLPVIGYRLDMALTPKWFVRSGTQLFYLEYGSYNAMLVQAQAAVEYRIGKSYALGAGVDTFALSLQDNESGFLGNGMSGSLGFRYTGLQIYARTFFN